MGRKVKAQFSALWGASFAIHFFLFASWSSVRTLVDSSAAHDRIEAWVATYLFLVIALLVWGAAVFSFVIEFRPFLRRWLWVFVSLELVSGFSVSVTALTFSREESAPIVIAVVWGLICASIILLRRLSRMRGP